MRHSAVVFAKCWKMFSSSSLLSRTPALQSAGCRCCKGRHSAPPDKGDRAGCVPCAWLPSAALRLLPTLFSQLPWKRSISVSLKCSRSCGAARQKHELKETTLMRHCTAFYL